MNVRPYMEPDPLTEHGLLREAYRRLHDDPVLSYRAKLAARVVRNLRVGDIKTGPAPGIDDDKVIAAIALVIADLALPGADTERGNLR